MGGNWKQMDISELHIAKELYLDLEAGRKASRNVVLLRPMLRIFYSHIFFLFTPEKRHYRPNSLSASTPPTSTCVEFFHNLVLIAVIDSGLYLATIVTSSSNADTRLLSLYLKTLKKNAHKDDWCRQGCVRKNMISISYSYIIYNCKNIDKYLHENRESSLRFKTFKKILSRVHISRLCVYFEACYGHTCLSSSQRCYIQIDNANVECRSFSTSSIH